VVVLVVVLVVVVVVMLVVVLVVVVVMMIGTSIKKFYLENSSINCKHDEFLNFCRSSHFWCSYLF